MMSVYAHYPVPLAITCLTASLGDNKLQDNTRIKDDEFPAAPRRIIYLGISGCTQAITPSYRAAQETLLILLTLWTHVELAFFKSDAGKD